MRLRIVAAILLALAVSSAAAQPAGVIVRTSLDPSDGVVVGQPVRLLVDVLFPGSMPRPPRVAVGDAPGAQILRFETQAITMRERIAGEAYVGQRFEFVAFPRRGGTIAVPAAEVTLLDAAGDPTGTARGQPQRFAVVVPPGIDASGPVLAASELKSTENWEPDPIATRFRAGDALTRTIRRRAPGVPSLGMADFAFAAPAGVRVYVDPARSDDKVERGAVEGSRTDKVVYVFEKPGTYAIPAITQPWWDLGERQARSAVLAGISVDVAAGPPARAAKAPENRALDLWIAAAVALGAALVGLYGNDAISACGRWWTGRVASEASMRAALRHIAKTGNAPETYRAMSRWLQQLTPERRAFARADPDLAPLAAELDGALFGNGAWSNDCGFRLARAAALVHDRSARAARTGRRPALPPLNPGARRAS